MILALFHCLLYQDPRNRIERERERDAAAAALISQPQPPLPHPVTDRRTPPPALSLHPTCSYSGCTCEEIREDFTVATTSSVRRSPPPSATTQPSPSHPTGSALPRVISRGPPVLHSTASPRLGFLRLHVSRGSSVARAVACSRLQRQPATLGMLRCGPLLLLPS